MATRLHWLLCLSLFCSFGCGSSTTTVTGTVTLDGTPLTTGNIFLHSTTSETVEFGQIGADGSYAVPAKGRSMPPGSYLVTVEASESPRYGPNKEEIPPKSLIPTRYNNKTTSLLKSDLKAGHNKLDLPLTSK